MEDKQGHARTLKAQGSCHWPRCREISTVLALLLPLLRTSASLLVPCLSGYPHGKAFAPRDATVTHCDARAHSAHMKRSTSTPSSKDRWVPRPSHAGVVPVACRSSRYRMRGMSGPLGFMLAMQNSRYPASRLRQPSAGRADMMSLCMVAAMQANG